MGNGSEVGRREVGKICILRLDCPWGFPGKNIGLGWHFLLQGIFLNRGKITHLLRCQADS